MPKWSEEEKRQHKERVKSILIRKPRVSQYELAKILGIDKDVALRLKKEIIAENTKYIDDQEVKEEIGKLEAEYEHLALECWQIITQDVRKIKLTKDGKEVEEEVLISAKDKMIAVKTLISAKKTLFNIKFDAGIFSKKLGELKLGTTLTDEEKDLLKKAIELDYGKPEATIQEPITDNGTGKEGSKTANPQ